MPGSAPVNGPTAWGREELPRTVELRRRIHRRPELAFQERETAATILEQLDPLGLEIDSGVAGTGIVADLVNDPTLPTVAFRADMDALPVQEQGESEFRSQVQGVAHLCGHDAHMAMLVATARILAARRGGLRCNVRFLFQPSEEKPPGGAPELIKAGALDGVAEVYGLHVEPRYPVGTVATRPGPMLAQSDRFDLTIVGKGGHGSMPHLTVDPIPVAAQVILGFQALAARKAAPADPIVLSVCRVQGGETFNVIPDEVNLIGTVRTLKEETGRNLPRWMEEMASRIAAGAGASVRFGYTRGYPPVVNHPQGVDRVRSASDRLDGVRFVEAEPTMYGEDFAYYLQQRPGAFVFLGVGNPALGISAPCHSSHFRIDEEALAIGPAVFARIALSF